MNIKVSFLRVSNLVLSLLCCGLLTVLSSPAASGQEQAESSRQASDVIKNVEAAGGRVLQISAADSNQEVSFYLAGDKITDEHLKDIGSIPDVVWLNLANTKITDDGLKQIAGMKLTKLHLEKTAIGDAGLAHLKDMADLEYLNLYATNVTDEGLKQLSKMSKLKRLYVWQSKVTEKGMKSLESQIPGLKVIGECKLPVIEEPKKDKPKMEKAKAEEPKKDAAKKDEPKKEQPKKETDK